MINVSSAFKKKLSNDERDYLEKIEMTLADGTELLLTNKDIWGSSLMIDDAVGGDSTFSAIGSAIVNSCSFTINNIYDDYSQYDFTDAVATASVGLNLGTVGKPDLEYAKKGVFTVNDVTYNGSMISVKLYDNMYKFDVPYQTNLVYEDGVTLFEIVDDACTRCGVGLGTNLFPNRDFVVHNAPSSDSTTFREVIAWCAGIAGCFARCNVNGNLELKWFDVDAIGKVAQEGLDGGHFDIAEKIETKDKIIATHISTNRVTLDYNADDGWWHISGTPNTTQKIEFPIYEDIISQNQDTYTIRIETKDLNSRSNPLMIGLNYWPDEDNIYYDDYASPFVSQIYSLTELSLVIPETSGSREAYDGYARIVIERGNTSSYQSGDIADGGTFNPWNAGYVIDMGDDFAWQDIHYISSTFNKNIGVDDIVITNVEAEVKTQSASDASGMTKFSYVDGEEGYSIHISGNEFIDETNAQTIVDWLGVRLKGLSFRKADVNHLSDPTIEAGDVAFVFDGQGNYHPILITRTSFKVGSSQETVCGAASSLRNSASRFAETIKAYVDIRKRLKEQKTAFEAAQAELGRRIESAQGMYYDEVEDPDHPGSYLRYLHDKPELSESDVRILFSDVGIHVTSNGTDEDPDWYGLEVNGTFVANQLYSVGINADYINTGAIVAKDENQNETFYVNVKTGVVRINASKFTVKVGNTESSINDYASGIADTAANSALNTSKSYTDNKVTSLRTDLSGQIGDLDDALNNLQQQLDNQITIHYEAYAPTRSNSPASEWIADGKEATHEGEVFCDTTTGYSYRWLKTNNVWGWNQIADTGTAQAIAAARDASILASQKKRVFVSQPIPPYETGDLWVQGSTGDIMRCKENVSRAEGSSYVANDWEKASKYTDDTVVNNLQIGGKNLLQKSADFDPSVWTFSSCSRDTINVSTAPISKITHYVSGLGTDKWYVEQNLRDAKADEKYTLSGYMQLYSYHEGDTDSIGIKWGDGVTQYPSSPVQSSETTSWQYFSITHKYIADATGNNSIRFVHSPYSAPAGFSRLYICGLKLEKGNRATDWTTSLEDVSVEIEAAVDALEDTLKVQIDSKVQTWVSSDDPSTNWTADEKAANVGDLWYYTGESIPNSYQNNCTYQYTSSGQSTPTYSWVSYSTSDDLFDAIDGKTTIYYGRPTGSGAILPPTYSLEEGDYLVDSTDGKTYRWDSTATKWINVTDYMTAAQNTLDNWVVGQYASDLDGLRDLVADSKIQTWYRDTDPSQDSSVWDASENHIGDIWYCNATTGTYSEKTWRWNGSSWSEMTSSPPQAVFDTLDGKAQIFIGTDTPVNPEDGDLWFRSADDPILSYVDSQWQEYNKYTDDTKADAVGENLDRVERQLSTEIQQLEESVTITINETNENLDEIKTHYRFDETGETIGKTNSQKSIKLSNDGIDMMVNNESVTKWNQDEMYTPTRVRVPVGGSLQLGDFIFQPRSSGNISLLFVGED